VRERDFHQVQAAVTGVPATRTVALAGGTWRLRKPALPPLLAWLARTPGSRDDTPARSRTAQLAASHRLLEAAVRRADWAALQDAAITSRAGEDDVQDAVRAVFEEWTAWRYWPAARLLAWLAAQLAERDGALLLRTGRPLSEMTPRQACNTAYAVVLDSMRSEEDRDQFIDDLFFEGDPDAAALAMVAQMRADRAAAAELEAAAPAGELTGPAGG
jgi:hypothetical protein